MKTRSTLVPATDAYRRLTVEEILALSRQRCTSAG